MSIPKPLKRIEEFEKLGFGMFVHWGLYSQLGVGEWALEVTRRYSDKNEYIKLKDTFTAENFDANKMAKIAKNAGIKYIVLTTRHHEGFSLYDTCGLNNYDALNSPAKRDLVKEFVDACNDEGIIPFFYHTTLDWIEKSFEEDFPKYQQYLRKSIEILCTKYGKIGGFWFDGNWAKPNDDWEEDALYSLIRKYQPDAIIINNTGLYARGECGHIELDSVTFEQGLPTPMNREGHKKYLAAEMCETLNNHWGIGENDLNYKSVATIIENLCSCRKVGANYLLNIGPTAQGGISLMDEAMLELIGRWIGVYGEAIYNTKPTKISSENKDFALGLDDDTAYLFIHNLNIVGNANVMELKAYTKVKNFYNVDKKVLSIKWIDNNEEISFTQDLANQILNVNATPFYYGNNYVVRVAKITYCS